MLERLEQIKFPETHLSPEVSASFMRMFEGNKAAMVSAAIEAEKRGVHWDDENRNPKMHVGCAILAIGKDLDISNPAIYTGANSKPVQGEMLPYPDRKCAEMNALENLIGIEHEGKIHSPGEEKEDTGPIAAIVTVSQPMNTGEVDTYDHDVVYSCKQCQRDYAHLLKENIISEETVIYNARIKDGKVVAGEPITLKKLFEVLKDGSEERIQTTLKQLIVEKNAAFAEYRQYLKKRNGNHKNNRSKDRAVSREPEVVSLLDSQRDKTEDLQLARENCQLRIIKAIKSATEESVPKQRILDGLGLEDVILSSPTSSFSEAELEQISKKYLDFMVELTWK